MKEINQGDYILGREEVFEVLAVRKEGVDTVYDLRYLSQPGEFLEVFDHNSGKYVKGEIGRDMIGVTRSYIRHLGEVVPKDSQRALEVLFGQNR